MAFRMDPWKSSQNEAKMGDEAVKIWPKMKQGFPKMSLRRRVVFNIHTDIHTHICRLAPNGPKILQDDLNMGQDGPKNHPQIITKMGDEAVKIWLKINVRCPKMAPRWPKMAPRWDKMGPR